MVIVKLILNSIFFPMKSKKKIYHLFISVINFFPVPVEEECQTEDGRRSGVCLNVYDCHRQGGTSKGQCALGFGACCVCK